MSYKVHFFHSFIYHPIQTIDLWSYITLNAKFDSKFVILCFDPILGLILALFVSFSDHNTYIWLTNHMCCIVLFTYLFRQCIYEVAISQKNHWPENLRFCIFDPHLALNLALFEPLRGPNTQIWLKKYIFCIDLFTLSG